MRLALSLMMVVLAAACLAHACAWVTPTSPLRLFGGLCWAYWGHEVWQGRHTS